MDGIVYPSKRQGIWIQNNLMRKKSPSRTESFLEEPQEERENGFSSNHRRSFSNYFRLISFQGSQFQILLLNLKDLNSILKKRREKVNFIATIPEPFKYDEFQDLLPEDWAVSKKEQNALVNMAYYKAHL